MATTPAVHSPAPTIEQVSSLPVKAYTRYPPDYFIPARKTPEGEFAIAPRYAGLSSRARAYVLATAKEGIPESGQRVGNCNRNGALWAKAEDNSLGLAFKFACGEMFGCMACGKGECRYHDWMYTREADRILSVPQIGVELSIPLRGQNWLNPRKKIRKLAKRFARSLGVSHAVMRDAIPTDYLNLRVALCLDSINIRDAVGKWLDIAGLNAEIKFRSLVGATGLAAQSLLEWVFSGWQDALSWPAEQQAAMRKTIGRRHLTSTMGTHYRPLSPEEVKRRHAEQRKEAMEQLAKRKDVKMIYIPREHRIVEPCDDIEAQVKHVIWGRELQPMTYRYAPYTSNSPLGRASP